MIRHSNSLLLSIIVHIMILSALFFLYIYISEHKEPEKKEEHRVCLQLCNFAEKKVEPLPIPIKKLTPPKKKEVKKKKPVVKPKIEKKEIVKKVEAKKKVLVVKEEIVKEVVVQKIEEPKAVEIENVITPTVVEITATDEVESTQEKNSRLESEYINKNILIIRDLIKDNLYYPRSARRRGVVGNVVVKFTLSTSAKIHALHVVSSNSEILSRAAIKTIENISSEFPEPDEELILNVPISYALE